MKRVKNNMRLNWKKITALEFENLCYDLLYALGFQNLDRRSGSPDRGRDIEAVWEIKDPSEDTYFQRWLVECNFSKHGIPVREIHDKIQWARVHVETHDVLLIMTNRHLTADARDWLESNQEKKVYNRQIQIWEKEKIEKLLLKYPSILEKYFPKPEVEIDFKPYLISIVNQNRDILEDYTSLNVSYRTLSGEEKLSKIDQLVENYHKLILIGAPGCGKTVTLRYLSTLFADRMLNEKEDSSLIPVYVASRFLKRGTLIDSMAKVIKSSVSNVTRSIIEAQLRQGKFLILFDGITESPNYEDNLNYIRDFITVFYRNKYVISSREFPKIEIDALIVEILPLDNSQIEELITKYAKKYGMKIPPDEDSRLYDLMKNPLMFRILVKSFLSREISSVDELMPISVNLKNYFEKVWEKEESEISPETKSKILSRIALRSHLLEQVSLPENQVQEIIKDCLTESLDEKGKHYSEIGIINYFIAQAILVKIDGRIGFAHALFQEYFYEKGLKEEQQKKGKELRPNVFRNAYSEFEKMIDDADLKESDFQKFLEENPWFFGGEYVKAYPQKRAGSELIEDFLLEKYDGFHDVVEIKRPNHRIFVGRENNAKPSSKCTWAISRIMDYLDYYERNVQEEYWKTGKQIYKPRGIVVIGRDQNTDKRKLRQLNSYVSSIDVCTYDDLLIKGKKIIELIEKGTHLDNN